MNQKKQRKSLQDTLAEQFVYGADESKVETVKESEQEQLPEPETPELPPKQESDFLPTLTASSIEWASQPHD
ncbi:hypothetical protein IQ238_08575 [Pleurocapsales cyanobacterium LEGE 06147]|nr:hypothetical protein [Pleurocapsales cyanobacterium LEGE 06147]